MDGDDKVRESYKRTPPEWPWIIHAAEGVDAEAAEEFERLVALGCVGANTLLVHGIGLDEKQRTRLAEAAGALIWCPASNLYLFGTTVDPTELIRRGQIALGTDSRLSGSKDLLEEIRVAVELAGLKPHVVESLVTREAARLLKLADRGVIEPGTRADILILPNGMPLSKATRADIRLVMVDGVGRYADEEYAHAAASGASWTDVRVDGRPKLLERKLATRLSQARTTEAGLELLSLTWRAA
jgi:cytosine/adenosine deaminase-related metal-dependent hydrolase